jgi:hypothetical protein
VVKWPVREVDRSLPYNVETKNVLSHIFPPLNVFIGWSRERGANKLYVSCVCEFYIVHFEFLSNAAGRLNFIIGEGISNEIKHTGTSNVIAVIKYRPIVIIVIDRLYGVCNINMRGRTGWSRGNALCFYAGVARFKCWSWHPIKVLRGYSSVPPSKFRNGISIMPLPLPCKSSEIHHSSAIPSSDSI